MHLDVENDGLLVGAIDTHNVYFRLNQLILQANSFIIDFTRLSLWKADLGTIDLVLCVTLRMDAEAISISCPSLKALYRGDGSEGRWDMRDEDCKGQ
jgi:hypothetical protein